MKSALLCFCLIAATFKPLRAQDATIALFSLTCKDEEFDIWDNDITSEFIYENSKHKRVAMRTVDTLFSYAQQTIASKLGLQLEKKKVGEFADQDQPFGEISGFPSERVKKVAHTGKYDRIIEVYAIAAPNQSSPVELVGITKVKYQFEMSVLIKVYDKSGKEIEKYRKTTKLEEPKKTRETRRELNHLSGNELFTLFVHAFNNALENKK
jgi:hypothetical protein